MRRTARIALGAGAALVGLNIALAVIGSLEGGTPGGPTSSSYATGADGAAAYSELLRDADHKVSALRKSPADLSPGQTVVLLDAVGVTADDAAELRSFAEAGGRLVVGGKPGSWLERIASEAPSWDVEGSKLARPIASVPETAGVDRVETGGVGAWQLSGPALPVVAGESGALVSILPAGSGRIVLLADASPLQNERLAHADNAALGLALAGPASRPVVFAESYHGYAGRSGLGAIPDAWLAAFGVGLAAIATFMLSRGRRLGPPEPDERTLAPARLGYVDALGALLARTRDRGPAGAALRDRTLRDSLRAVTPLARTTASEAEAEAPAGPVLTDAELVVAGEMLARVETSMRRNT